MVAVGNGLWWTDSTASYRIYTECQSLIFITAVGMPVHAEVKFLQYASPVLCENYPQLNETACFRPAE